MIGPLYRPLYSVAALPGKWTGIRRYRRHNTLYGARAALALAEQRAGKGTVQIRALCRWCLHWSPHGQPCTKHITNERTKG